MLDDSLRATHIIKHSKLKHTVTFNKYLYVETIEVTFFNELVQIWYNS